MPLDTRASVGGSSPRLRGTLQRFQDARPSARFIPALAGNTLGLYDHVHAITVHPRACGEHWESTRSWPHTAGSSPRLRGTLYQRQRQSLNFRFIPALAGNTRGGRNKPSSKAVHPRACGEHLVKEIPLLLPDGSSPRLRGTLVAIP